MLSSVRSQLVLKERKYRKLLVSCDCELNVYWSLLASINSNIPQCVQHDPDVGVFNKQTQSI